MKVVEIRGETELQNLRPAWNALLAESRSNTIFLSWEWASAWWSAYGTAGELRILTAVDDDNVLRGIAPMRAQRMRRYGSVVSTLSFVGDGSFDSDYLDFIIAAGYEKQALEAFWRYWRESSMSSPVLMLNEIPEGSPNLPQLRNIAEADRTIWTESEVPCGVVQLPDTWEEYVAALRPRFRTKVRSVLRNLENRPEVSFRFCTNAREVERALPVLFDLHTRRWMQEGNPGVFGTERKRDFYQKLSAVLSEREWLRFSFLEWNGNILACQYGFRYGDSYFQLQEGYEPGSEHWNVGVGLRAWTIREFLKEGIRKYDFMGGMSRHKADWGATDVPSRRIVIAPRTYRTTVFCRGPEWEATARESIKKLLPPKVLNAGRALIARRATAGNESAWLRRNVAAYYFHSGLPKLSRGLRDRYEVSVSKSGRWPKATWKPKAASSARILYYHRVNDENDPFFGAISTSLFDQQMRYLARHYKVLSLSEIVSRLEEGRPAETVVGITFDDGYRDNYENAFPILKKYGLPATIFATTGSIDSGEPLWFERLAEAVKKTTREFLDLEFDFPRRFWMRTEPERLASHNQLFGLLRGATDAQRHLWLPEILRQLDGPDVSGRTNKMLTWDQIRLMKANGIDFGGHTVTHPFLSKLEPRQAEWEISECKRRIEEELQQRTDFFAYPNGRREDFGASDKELLRAAGYRGALSTIWGMNNPSTDRMELRRGGPWESTAALFAYKLDWYQLVNE